MKLPITRATTGCATSLTRSHVSRAGGPQTLEHAERDRAISSSCSAIRLA